MVPVVGRIVDVAGHATSARRVRASSSTDPIARRTFGMVALVVFLSGLFAACQSALQKGRVQSRRLLVRELGSGTRLFLTQHLVQLGKNLRTP